MVLEGHEELAEKRRTDPSSTDFFTLAAERGDVATVRRVLEQGFRVDTPDTLGFTALNWAILSSQREISRVLLAAGADTEQSVGERMESHPLRWCAEHNDVEMASILLAAGAHAEGHPNSVMEVIEPIREIMRERGMYADGQVPYETSRSPLMTAIQRGYLRFAQLLLEQGIDVEESQIDAGGPLRSAVLHHYPDMVAPLLASGAAVSPALLKLAERLKNETLPVLAGPRSEVPRDHERTMSLIRRALKQPKFGGDEPRSAS